jgi:hypothetical protein
MVLLHNVLPDEEIVVVAPGGHVQVIPVVEGDVSVLRHQSHYLIPSAWQFK